MVSSQEVMRLDRKVYSASDVDPNHAVQRKRFPQVSVFDWNEGNELTLMVKLKIYETHYLTNRQAPKKRQQKPNNNDDLLFPGDYKLDEIACEMQNTHMLCRHFPSFSSANIANSTNLHRFLFMGVFFYRAVLYFIFSGPVIELVRMNG